ncbi:zinc-binding dehydrogenase [Chondromyces apiculatus]|uniref:Alcohol dehydrogenase n=1 Tax=Chondromyces apiculatus DSM 436 TaxID=1192034 RepID=A0A017SU47_9BACT|nr:zinc-binding dehydrogenase [Chondromyces apiculatus]EYF00503.1 Alcohol dehydrogenase [Chondromyces apiculatus DSM 436]
MLAGRLDLTTGTFGMQEIPIPEPGPGEVRLKVEAAGICLSDVHLIDGTLPVKARRDFTQVTLGHEVAGVIDRLGPGVTPWQVGQRVLLHAGQVCGKCQPCLVRSGECLRVQTRGVDYDGGWAEYALARQDTVAAVPEDLPIEQAAILPDAVSTPYAALLETAALRPAESVGLWGIGGLGAHAVQIARLLGAAPILAFDLLPEARARALSFGADAAFDPREEDLRDKVRRATDGRGLDVAVDLAGVPAARAQAQALLGPRGRLVLVGVTPEALSVDNSLFFCTLMQQVRGHYGSTMGHLLQLVKLTRHRRLELSRSISALLPLADAPLGVERLAKKEGHPIRLILKP